MNKVGTLATKIYNYCNDYDFYNFKDNNTSVKDIEKGILNDKESIINYLSFDIDELSNKEQEIIKVLTKNIKEFNNNCNELLEKFLINNNINYSLDFYNFVNSHNHYKIILKDNKAKNLIKQCSFIFIDSIHNTSINKKPDLFHVLSYLEKMDVSYYCISETMQKIKNQIKLIKEF